jgi:predicted  nucleic acid-binding Zn-ribbon protein
MSTSKVELPQTQRSGTKASAAQLQQVKRLPSLGEISAIRDNYDTLTMQLETARELAGKKEAQLLDAMERQASAEKLLSLLEGATSFDDERQLASRVIAECQQARVELEPIVKNVAGRVRRIEAEIAEIDQSSFARLKEIRSLAGKLRGR